MFSGGDKRPSRVFADPRTASEGRLVKARPIDSKFAKRLGDQHRGKDFVTATDTYKDFAAGYEVVEDEGKVFQLFHPLGVGIQTKTDLPPHEHRVQNGLLF